MSSKRDRIGTDRDKGLTPGFGVVAFVVVLKCVPARCCVHMQMTLVVAAGRRNQASCHHR